MSELPRAVLDRNVLLQAVSSTRGPAARCLSYLLAEPKRLIACPAVLLEAELILADARLQAKLRFTSADAEHLLAHVRAEAELLPDPTPAFTLKRDPKDAVYVDLAIVSGALLIVSRDRDLLDLMRDDDPVGVALRRDHPTFRILTPPEFLTLIDASPAN